MMRDVAKRAGALLLYTVLCYTAQAQVEQEVVAGLRQALTRSTELAVGRIGQQDGYLTNNLIKILLPPEAAEAEKLLTTAGGYMGKALVNDVITRMNRAAEQAVANPQTKQIFLNAVKNLSIQNGIEILRGDSIAATRFLRTQTEQPLQLLFAPLVRAELDKMGVGTAWTKLSGYYNNLIIFRPGAKRVPDDLGTYATQKALDGMFLTLGQEEAKIRKDPVARTTDLLKKVFGGIVRR